MEVLQSQDISCIAMMSKLRKRASENDLVKRLRALYGGNTGKRIVLCIGDWSASDRGQLRGMHSTPHIGLRRFLAKHFLVLTINEKFTTKTCSGCKEHSCEPCMYVRKDVEQENVDNVAVWYDGNKGRKSKRRKKRRKRPKQSTAVSTSSSSISHEEKSPTDRNNWEDHLQREVCHSLPEVKKRVKDETGRKDWWRLWREVHGLRKCSNTACGVTYLSRDGNAAVNILDLAKAGVLELLSRFPPIDVSLLL